MTPEETIARALLQSDLDAGYWGRKTTWDRLAKGIKAAYLGVASEFLKKYHKDFIRSLNLRRGVADGDK